MWFTLFQLASYDPFLWFCALAGSGMFIIQFLLILIGVTDHNEILESSSPADAGNFKWLSKQALTGCLMMFGWTALTCKKQFALNDILSLSIALVAAFIAVWLTGYMFKMAKMLHSPGNVFNIEDFLGKDATVYQRIPREGVGKISVSLYNFTHEIDAITEDDQEIPSFTHVEILRKVNNNTVLVSRKS